LLLVAATPETQPVLREPAFLGELARTPAISVSTMPRNGDQNPYGVAVVPAGFPAGGLVVAGDILVSNFNNGQNQQGRGRTIVAHTAAGRLRTVFTMPASLGPVGLTTALWALRAGLIVVGNTPTTNGMVDTIQRGSLIFLSRQGHVLLDLSDSALLQGPWDMTADEANPEAPILYVSNVLDGTVTRIIMRIVGGEPVIESLTRVASGFLHRPDPAALVVGPTGLLLDHTRNDLYVADTGNNRIQFVAGVHSAAGDLGAGKTIVSGPPLRGPLALAATPIGTIVASNGDAAGSASTAPNMVVEFNPAARRVIAARQLDNSGTPGAIFGIAIDPVDGRTSLLYVNDNSVTLNVLPVSR
jgi:hypothetical protein